MKTTIKRSKFLKHTLLHHPCYALSAIDTNCIGGSMLNYKILLIAAAVLALTGCHKQVKPPSYIEVPPTKPMQPPVEHINLTSDTLFRFNASGAQDLLPSGRAKLDEIARGLQSRYVSIQNIELVGHTDRLGQAEYNYNLGMKRAKTVYDYLRSRGIPANAMSYKSAGENQPVTDGCVNVTPRSSLIQCLQPDRRVSIAIQGVKR
jgi:outer membrane protein OmpA-like peptidoglycan-associated protein